MYVVPKWQCLVRKTMMNQWMAWASVFSINSMVDSDLDDSRFKTCDVLEQRGSTLSMKLHLRKTCEGLKKKSKPIVFMLGRSAESP